MQLEKQKEQEARQDRRPADQALASPSALDVPRSRAPEAPRTPLLASRPGAEPGRRRRRWRPTPEAQDELKPVAVLQVDGRPRVKEPPEMQPEVEEVQGELESRG